MLMGIFASLTFGSDVSLELTLIPGHGQKRHNKFQRYTLLNRDRIGTVAHQFIQNLLVSGSTFPTGKVYFDISTGIGLDLSKGGSYRRL